MFDNEKLIELFQGKKVCLLGPASYLTGKNLGKVFDSYDLVIRVNDIFPKFQEEDRGSRSDILFYTFPSLDIYEYSMKLMMNVDVVRKIKMFVCPTIKADHQFKDNIEDNIKKINIYNFPYSVISKDEYYYVQNYFGTEPNTVPNSLLILLKYGVKEVLLSGATFYAEFDANNVTVQNAYYSGYYLSIPRNWSPFRGHDQFRQRDIFKNKILKEYEGIVKIDSYLKDLLNIDYENVLNVGDVNV